MAIRPEDRSSKEVQGGLAAFAALAGAVWLAVALWTAFAYGDEALSSLRTALNLAARGFATFNPLDRVLTFDHPLWLLAECVCVAATGHYALVLKAIGVACAAGAAFLALRSSPGPKGWLLMVLVPLVPLFRRGFSSGLEPPLVALLLSAMAAGLAGERSKGGQPRSGVMAEGALVFLSKFWAGVLVAPLLLRGILSGPPGKLVRRALPAALPVAVWLGISLAYFRGLVPHSVQGELARPDSLGCVLRFGGLELAEAFMREPLGFALIGLAGAKTVAGLFSGRRRDFTDWLGWGLLAGTGLSTIEGAEGWSADRVSLLIWLAFLILTFDQRIPNGLFALSLGSAALFFGGAAASNQTVACAAPPQWPSRASWAEFAESSRAPRMIFLGEDPGLTGLTRGPSAYVLGRLALADPFWSSRNRAAGAVLSGTAGRPSTIPFPEAPAWSGQAPPLDAAILRLRLRERSAGISEPLLSVGDPERGELFMVEYLGGRKIRLAAYLAGFGTVLTSPILREVDFSRPHEVALKYGLGPGPIEWRAQVRMGWDGRLVKRIGAPYRALGFPPGTAIVGWNALSAPNCESAFSGAILKACAAPGAAVAELPSSRSEFLDRVTHLRVMPLANAGGAQPLVTTGREGSCDALFFEQTGPEEVRFGHDHSGFHAVDWGDAVRLDFSRPHDIELIAARRGFGGFLKTNLTAIRLDGRIVFVTLQDFHPFGADEVYLLENPVAATTCLPAFKGEILGVSARIPRPEEADGWRGKWDFLRQSTGPLRFVVLFGGAPFGMGQALVETGQPGKGDIVYLVQDDATHYHFGFDHWGVAGFVGPPFPIDTSAPHRVEIEMPSLLAVSEKSGGAGHAVRVRVDGRTVLSAESDCHPSSQDELYVAANHLGATTTGMPFQGTIVEARRGRL